MKKNDDGPTGLEITIDRASKFYEPGEKVTGKINILNFDRFAEMKRFEVKAEAYMDTVSQIRGNMGRAALDESKRIYFMKKKITSTEIKSTTNLARDRHREYEFVLE